MTTRSPHCLEYFDEPALSIAGIASARPWDAEARAMVYLEDDAGEGTADALLDAWLEIAESNGAITGGIRVFEGSQAFREARAMRHAVPTTMNERGNAFRAGGGRKVSTDWAVPYRLLARALELSGEAVTRHGAPSPVTYGHAGNGHPHQNFIAEDARALDRVNAAVEDTVRSVLSLGGTISAEHGLGKLKRKWLTVQLSDSQAGVMRAMKNALDPRGMFGPGNLF
jgi:FAD/FMN-containing dehydrogenase